MLSLSEPSSSTSTTLFSNSRKHRRRRRTPHYSSPSPGLLSLLATVVSSTFVSASPVALPFLCPGVEEQFSYPRREISPVDTKTTRIKGRRRRLPDRYVRGSDGLWRKTDWSLYGSSMCVDCPQSTSSTSMPTADADDSVNTGAVSATTTTSTAAASTTSADDFMDSLPPGWKPIVNHDNTAKTLSISLSLAFFICITMIFCVIWRRGKRRLKDVEKPVRKSKANSSDDLEVMIEKEVESKKRVLARATARWKANARYTFRQRRGKRRAVPHTEGDADVPPTNTTLTESSPSSPAHSRRSSVDSVLTPKADSFVDQIPLSTSGERPSLLLPPVSSPPAYLHHSLSSNHHNIAPSGNITPTASYVQSRRTSMSSLTPDAHCITQPAPYTSSHHMAHVATDDKALLERLNQLVSAPDVSGLSTRHDTTTFAPVWQDEELSDYTELEEPRRESTSTEPVDNTRHAYQYPSHNGGTMVFPPPPVLSFSLNEKGKGVEVYPYEYSYHPDRSYGSSFEYEQAILDVEPEAGPSAPPFESTFGVFDTTPSAPPFEPSENHILEHPSAPNLQASDDLNGGFLDEGSTVVETYDQNTLTGKFAVLSEDSIRPLRTCVSVVSPEESSLDGLLASHNDRDPDGRTFESSPSM